MNINTESLAQVLGIGSLIFSLVLYVLLLIKSKGMTRILVIVGLGILIFANLIGYTSLPESNLELLFKSQILNSIGSIILAYATILYILKAKK